MNYRKVYSKLIRLGKDKTPEGANARSKARNIKGKRIGGGDHRKTRKRNPGYYKGGLNDEHIDPDDIDKMFRDLENYNYKYIPIEKISYTQMDAKYIPHHSKPSCPKCNLPNIDREPILEQLSGIRWKCWLCDTIWVKSSSNKLIKVEDVKNKNSGDDDPSNPGNLLHKGKRIIGNSGPPKGTPGNPRVIP